MTTVKRFLASETTLTILVISLVACLAYGIFIPRLGLYWDEMMFTWVAHVGGASGLAQALVEDRPVLGLLWGVEYSIIGQNILIWQLLALVTRIASGLAVLWLFHELWPKRRYSAFAAALLFTIYPGFLQQPIAFMYQLTFVTLSLSSISLAAMVHSQKALTRRSQWLWSGLALLTLIFELLFIEYFLGLELLRVLLLWYIIIQTPNHSFSKRFVALIRKLLPYLLVTAVFLFWRVFIFHSQRDATDINTSILAQFQGSFLGGLLPIPVEFVRSFLEGTLFAWFAPAFQFWLSATLPFLTAMIILLLFSLTIVGGYSWLLQRRNRDSGSVEDNHPSSWGRHLILIGLIAAPGALFFVLLSGRHIRLMSSTDRYTLPMLLPVVLIVVGVIDLAAKPRFRIWVVAGLAALAVTTHFANANIYQNQWNRTTDMWWQIAWRIPQVKANTTFVIEDHDSQIPNHEDYTVWGAANLVYRSSERTTDFYGEFLDDKVVTKIRTQSDETKNARGLQIDQNNRHVLIVVRQDAACLRLIDSSRLELPQDSSGQLIAVSEYSQLDRVVADAEPVRPPVHLFGPEPAHGWCFYFQKADLARQTGDYQQALDYAAEAERRGFAPHDPTEWLPFFESAVILGQHDQAATLINRILDSDPHIVSDVCRVLLRHHEIDHFPQVSCQSAP